jgi:1,4-alpha-glucan branching enzyme
VRILCLATEFPPARGYGLSRYISEQAAAMVRCGAAVDVACNNWDSERESYRWNGVGVCNAPLRVPFDGYTWISDVLQNNVQLLARCSDMLRRNGGYDVLHVHDWLAASAAKALKANSGLPLVVSMHDTQIGKCFGELDDNARYIADMECWLLGLADRVLANSQFIKRELVEAYHVPPEKIDVVYAGVNPESFSTDANVPLFRSLFCRPEERLIAFVGRLARVKGVHVMLEAIPAVAQVCPNARFVLAGDGDMRPALEKRAHELGVAERVRFIGHIAGKVLATFLHAADMVVVPSLYEPLGMVALEAMACARPVIATETGGLKEIVQPGATGTTVPPNDPQALSQAIVQLLFNQEAAKALGEQAKEHVQREFTWDAVARRALQACEAVRR